MPENAHHATAGTAGKHDTRAVRRRWRIITVAATALTLVGAIALGVANGTLVEAAVAGPMGAACIGLTLNAVAEEKAAEASRRRSPPRR